MVIRDQEFRSLDGGVTLTTRIAAVHIVHRATCEHIHWFGQLTSYSPGILSGMVQEELGKTEGMVRAGFLDAILPDSYRSLNPPYVLRCSICMQWREC